MNQYKFDTHGDMFHEMINIVLTHGNITSFNNNEVGAKEITYVTCEVKQPNKRCEFQSISTLFFDIVETIFTFSGKTNSYVSKQYKSMLEIFDKDGHFPDAPGIRLFDLYGDQIDKCLTILSKESESRKAIICLMDPKNNITCCTHCQFLIRNGKLDLFINYRAADLINFSNSDVFKWSTLQELMANWLNVSLGSFYYSCASLHVIDPWITAAELLIERGKLLNYKDCKIKNIPVNMDYIGWKDKFALAMDILLSWHVGSIGKPQHVVNEIENYDLPHFLQYWLKVILCERYLQKEEVHKVEFVISNLEDSDIKRSLIYFLNNPAHEELEVV